MSQRTIGLIGFGAIGQEVAARLTDGAVGPIRLLVYSLDFPADGAGALPVTRVGEVEEMIAARPDLVIEAAGHKAVEALVPRILGAGIPVLVASIGSLADDELHRSLQDAAAASGAPLLLPSGAIGGIDYVEAVRMAAPLSVRYTSRKPPAAWRDELRERGVPEDGLNGEYVLFEGSAREAARLFPKNLNVAPTLALAGTGMEQTRVRVVADPQAAGNTHEIDVESGAGRARMVFENTPSRSNPKTSALTALSILRSAGAHLLANPCAKS